MYTAHVHFFYEFRPFCIDNAHVIEKYGTFCTKYKSTNFMFSIERPWTGTRRGKGGEGDLDIRGEELSTMRH